MNKGQFTIRTDKPNVKVSWQITAVRKDPYAVANPMQVVEDKGAAQGTYRYPEGYGQPTSGGEHYQLLQALRSRKPRLLRQPSALPAE